MTDYNQFFKVLEKTLFKALILSKLKTDRFNSVYDVEDFYQKIYLTELLQNQDFNTQSKNKYLFFNSFEYVNLSIIIASHYLKDEDYLIDKYQKYYKNDKIKITSKTSFTEILNDLIVNMLDFAKSIENDNYHLNQNEKIEAIKDSFEICDKFDSFFQLDKELYFKLVEYDKNRINRKEFKNDYEKFKYYKEFKSIN